MCYDVYMRKNNYLDTAYYYLFFAHNKQNLDNEKNFFPFHPSFVGYNSFATSTTVNFKFQDTTYLDFFHYFTGAEVIKNNY